MEQKDHKERINEQISKREADLALQNLDELESIIKNKNDIHKSAYQ